MTHSASIREAFEDCIEDKLDQMARPASSHFFRSNVEPILCDTGIMSIEQLPLQAIRRPLLEHKDLSRRCSNAAVGAATLDFTLTTLFLATGTRIGDAEGVRHPPGSCRLDEIV